MRGGEGFALGYMLGSGSSPVWSGIRSLMLFVMAIGCAGGVIGFALHLREHPAHVPPPAVHMHHQARSHAIARPSVNTP